MTRRHSLPAQIDAVDRVISSYARAASKRGDPFQSRHQYELGLMEGVRESLAFLQEHEHLIRGAIAAKQAAQAARGGG